MVKQLKFFALILLTAHCSDNEPFQPENFVGTWIVTQVLYDDALQTEWTGTHMTLEQNKIDGGLYSMTDTKYDSIWSSNGTWKKSNEQFELIFDDTLTVNFSFENDKLTVIKRLPWTAQSTCNGGICLPVVTGYWDFRFEREK